MGRAYYASLKNSVSWFWPQLLTQHAVYFVLELFLRAAMADKSVIYVALKTSKKSHKRDLSSKIPVASDRAARAIAERIADALERNEPDRSKHVAPSTRDVS